MLWKLFAILLILLIVADAFVEPMCSSRGWSRDLPLVDVPRCFAETTPEFRLPYSDA